MTYLKKYGLRLGWAILGAVVSLVAINTLYYFNLIGDGFYKFLELIVVIGDVFINSFILGKASSKKGYLEGLKFSLVIITLLLVSTLLFSSFKVKLLIYYLIISITAVLGSMIGISRKKTSD